MNLSQRTIQIYVASTKYSQNEHNKNYMLKMKTSPLLTYFLNEWMKIGNYVLSLAVKSQASLYMNAHFSVCEYLELGLSDANSKNVINIRKYFSGMPLDANITFFKTLNSMRTYMMKQMAEGTMLTVTYLFVLIGCNYFPLKIPYSGKNTKKNG